MKNWLVTKDQWSDWNLIDRCTYIGTGIGVLSFILGCGGLLISILSLGNASTTAEKVSDISDIVTKNVSRNVHIIAGDVILNLGAHMEDRSSKWNASVTFQARKSPILLINKAELLEYEIEERYLTTDDLSFKPTLKLTDVKFDQISLESIGDITNLQLKFEPSFVFISANNLTWRLESIRGDNFGYLKVKLYYIYNEQELSETIQLPIILE
jgi:hypothetical protein